MFPHSRCLTPTPFCYVCRVIALTHFNAVTNEYGYMLHKVGRGQRWTRCKAPQNHLLLPVVNAQCSTLPHTIPLLRHGLRQVVQVLVTGIV